MSFIDVLLILVLLAITITRAILNARTFNNLHKTENEMIITATQATPEEIQRSSESFLFAMYCAFIIVWFKFKKGDIKYVIYNYLLTMISIVILIVLLH